MFAIFFFLENRLIFVQVQMYTHKREKRIYKQKMLLLIYYYALLLEIL